MKTNKLTIYLIKSEYVDFAQIVNNNSEADTTLEQVISENAALYYRKSYVSTPKWVRTFLGATVNEEVYNALRSSSAQALVLLKVEVAPEEERIFAVAFGTGRHLINEAAVDRNFGLRTVLNSLLADQIRYIDTKDVSTNPRHRREQVARPSETSEFHLNIERDILSAITGRSSDPEFGKLVQGGSALQVLIKQDVESLPQWLPKAYAAYQSDQYKKDFSWVDLVAKVKDSILERELDEVLCSKVNRDEIDGVLMAVPGIIDWKSVANFRYGVSIKDEVAEADLDFQEFLFKKEVKGELTVAFLRENSVTAWDENGTRIYKWSAYRCMVAEIEHEGKNYVLTDATWYAIDGNFLNEVNRFYKDELGSSNIDYIPYSGGDEGAYNIALSAHLDAALLDQKLVKPILGARSVEVCDVMTEAKHLIHIKRGTRSSTLSHLFNQGVVSAQLLAGDRQFREATKEKLPHGKKGFLSPSSYRSSEWVIVYAILGRGERSLPFFSKVSLRQAVHNLRSMQYKVCLDMVSQE